MDSVQNPDIDIKEEVFKLSKELIDSRQSMAPLINTIGFLIHDLPIITKKILKKRIEEFKTASSKWKIALEKNFYTFMNSRVKDEQKVMLISYSSTIINLLLKNKDRNIIFYVLESRPLLEGRRVAEKLSKYFQTNLIIDAAIGKFINQIDLVLIGIDSILRDGSIINKIGTYPLALLAKSNKIDVYAVGDSFKYNLIRHYGQEIIIEKKPSNEIYNKKTNNNLKIHNYYFDFTHPEYITGIISELGVLSIQKFLQTVKESLLIEWLSIF